MRLGWRSENGGGKTIGTMNPSAGCAYGSPSGVNFMDKDRVSSAAQDAAGKIQSGFGKVTGDTTAEVEGNLHEVGGTMQNVYGQAKDAVRDAGETVAGFAEDVYRDGGRAVASQIRHNPLGSLVVAGAVGFALALMLNRPARGRRR
jgi:uncharacterized protein YjbJ (UPF0337 family)